MAKLKLNLDYKKLDFKCFPMIADMLLNQCLLMVNGNKFRLVEIEFYLNCPTHVDPYVHCLEDQLLFRSFYFHRFKNGTYKGGTFKGLDITFGNKKTETYFGILIRSIESVADSNIIEGPCNVVNRILAEYNIESILEFTNGQNLNIDDNDNNFILISKKNLPRKELFIGQRIGLSAAHPDYQLYPYRFATNKDKLKKKKTTLFELDLIDSVD